jgi:Flp pilus assembly protein protease CpaA
MTISAPHLIPLAGCCVAAGYFDIARRKIPNSITATAAVLGLGMQLWDNGILAALSGLAAAVLTIAVLYRVWSSGGMGGGDVKFAAAVSIWIGLGKMVSYALATAVAGGLVAAACYFLSKATARKEIRDNLVNAVVTQSLPPIPISPGGAASNGSAVPAAGALAAGRMSVPYGIAVIVGGAVALWAPWGL